MVPLKALIALTPYNIFNTMIIIFYEGIVGENMNRGIVWTVTFVIILDYIQM
jgi:hypothetical protein